MVFKNYFIIIIELYLNNNKYINSLLNSFILLDDKILIVLNNIKE